MKISESDIRFFFRAIASAMLIMLGLQAYQSYRLDKHPSLTQVEDAALSMVQVNASDIGPLLQRTDGKPVMLVVYASWCVPCHTFMPVVTGLVRSHAFGQIQPVFISLDGELMPIGSYLAHNDYAGLFRPYLLRQGQMAGFEALVSRLGGHFSGHIPYTAIFSGAKTVAESFGVVDKDRLLAMAASVK